jgi:hypothetical protein
VGPGIVNTLVGPGVVRTDVDRSVMVLAGIVEKTVAVKVLPDRVRVRVSVMVDAG